MASSNSGTQRSFYGYSISAADGEVPSVAAIAAATGAIAACGYAVNRWLHQRLQDRLWKASIQGRVVVITGCDTGIGNLVAYKALNAGFTVVAACYTEQGAQELDSLAKSGLNITTVVANLMTKEGRKRVVEAAETATIKTQSAQGGQLHALVNNAGFATPGNVDWVKPHVYEDLMNLNFHAPVELTYELLPLLKKSGNARIVNVTSVAGILSLPGMAAYSASKHALEAFGDSLRCEMIPWGVKVVAIEPAAMKTPLVMKFADDLKESFESADVERKDQYGAEWMDTVYNLRKDGMKHAMDPNVAASDVLRALEERDPPPRILSGFVAKYIMKPISWLPDGMRDSLIRRIITSPNPTPMGLVVPCPPMNKLAYVSIRVSNLERSVEFYQKLGFLKLHEALAGQQFLRSKTDNKAPNKQWKPLVLLVEDPTVTPRTEVHSIGMTRLCLYTHDLDHETNRLREMGIEPAYAPVIDTLQQHRVATYKDPDGFIVYYIQYMGLVGFLFRLVGRFSKDTICDPMLLHWTINVQDATTAKLRFEALEFQSYLDQDRFQIRHDVLPAFGLKPYPDSIVEHSHTCKLPDDNFFITLLEWKAPVSRKSGQELSNSIAISVPNAQVALQFAKSIGLTVDERIGKTVLPHYGQVRVASAYAEEGSNRIDFIQF